MANWQLVMSPKMEPMMVNFDNVSYFEAAYRPKNNANTVIAFSAQQGDNIVVAERLQELTELISDDK